MSSISSDCFILLEALITVYGQLWDAFGPADQPRPKDDDLRSALIGLTKNATILAAFGTCTDFRNTISHHRYTDVDFIALGSAINTFGMWMRSSPKANPNERYIVLKMAITICQCYANWMVIKQTVDVIPRQDVQIAASSTETLQEAEFHDTEISFDDVKLSTLKVGYKEQMKGAKIQILDGKTHAGKYAYFRGWNGTVASIFVQGDDAPTKIPLDRRVRIVRWPIAKQ